jgi:nicotinate phosphoribosyltransferase
LTDLYELTMVRGYVAAGMRERAVFELFVRALPATRGFLLAAGLEQALDFLTDLRFERAELDELERRGKVAHDLVESLRDLRFTGDVDAVPEGTVVFENEPIVQVSAPLPEAQLVETRLMNLVHLETMIASAAARSVLAAPGKLLVDFGVRRAHGFEAGLLAARAAYIAGFAGTSTVLAGMRFAIPLYGTMAHSFIEAHDDELEAFRSFARANPDDTIFLIDTYDSERGAQKVVALAREGIVARGVRIDSGDLADHARRVRRILDEGGLRDCKIIASGGLDEHALQALVTAGAPIDGFGIGTRLDTSADAPYLDCAYKLEEYAGRPRRKRSEGKATWPGKKQVHRLFDKEGAMRGDIVTLAGAHEEGEPLLVPAMRAGRRVHPAESLVVIRERAARSLAALPAHLRALEVAPPYTVRIAERLEDLAAELDERARAPTYDASTALLVLDVQNDFASRDGSLYVEGAEEILPFINREIERARRAGARVVYTQDCHPERTPHFETDGGPWPVHCVRNTWGAALHPQLVVEGDIVRKGTGGEDGYSGFSVRDPTSLEQRRTELEDLLRREGIRHVVLIGLATDYCVKETALDAARLGFETTVLRDGVRAVDIGANDGESALGELAQAGIDIA